MLRTAKVKEFTIREFGGEERNRAMRLNRRVDEREEEIRAAVEYTELDDDLIAEMREWVAIGACCRPYLNFETWHEMTHTEQLAFTAALDEVNALSEIPDGEPLTKKN